MCQQQFTFLTPFFIFLQTEMKQIFFSPLENLYNLRNRPFFFFLRLFL